MKNLSAIAANSLALAIAVAAISPASAQIAARSKAPVDIAADHLSTLNNDCLATYQGNVEALQDTGRLRTDQLKVFFAQKGGKTTGGGGACGDLSRMEAHGAVYYVTPNQRVHGSDALYEAGPDTITVTGDVILVQGQNVLRGERLVINTQTGEAHMETGVTGRNKPGRVRGVFYPKQSDTPAQAGQPAQPAGKPR